jgi:hypothetical protein
MWGWDTPAGKVILLLKPPQWQRQSEQVPLYIFTMKAVAVFQKARVR